MSGIEIMNIVDLYCTDDLATDLTHSQVAREWIGSVQRLVEIVEDKISREGRASSQPNN